MKNFKTILSILILVFVTQKSFSEMQVSANYAIIQDHLSGEILYEKDADTRIYPASMTKIMTTIVAFDFIKSGETSFDELIIVSENAWRMSQSGYSSMFIMLDDQVSVFDLLMGIIIVSGNDACVALAEGLSGNEAAFAVVMNEKAKEIGMEDTNFSNSSGISDPDNYSTVRDILKMSRYLIINYPEFYEYFKEKTFTWDRTGGDPITQGNRNPLLYKNIGVDGIKTGFLTVEKYSLSSSMLNKGRRINVVGSGFASKNSRSRESAKMLSWGYRTFDTVKIALKNSPIDSLKVWEGKKKIVEAVTFEDVYLSIPKRKKKSIKAVMEYTGPIKAPIRKGDKIGLLNIYINGELKKKVNLYSNENIKRANIFSRLFNSLNYLVWGDV